MVLIFVDRMCALSVALIDLGRCHSILLEREPAVELFLEAEAILGVFPSTTEMAEWWGDGNCQYTL